MSMMIMMKVMMVMVSKKMMNHDNDDYYKEPSTNAVEDNINSSAFCPFLNCTLELLLPVVDLGGDADDDDDHQPQAPGW